MTWGEWSTGAKVLNCTPPSNGITLELVRAGSAGRGLSTSRGLNVQTQVQWGRVSVRPSSGVVWHGWLAELTGACGLPCVVGKSASELGARRDLLAQLGGLVVQGDERSERLLVRVG